jgi:methylisocitrate lyase
MADQAERARAFGALHVPGRPLILYNIWDVGSAQAVAAAGAKALATGSLSVAAANGFGDGEQVPIDFVLANAARIARAVELPVTLDFERGYGGDAAEVEAAVAALIETGVVGCNIEDSIDESHRLRPIDEQAARIASARAAADRAGIRLFINVRVDVFFGKPAEQHDEAMVEEALARGRALAEAGADGLFLPLLVSESLIERVAAESALPLNVMAVPGAPSAARLAELGVARVSFGPGPYRTAMRQLEEAARAVFQSAEMAAVQA